MGSSNSVTSTFAHDAVAADHDAKLDGGFYVLLTKTPRCTFTSTNGYRIYAILIAAEGMTLDIQNGQ